MVAHGVAGSVAGWAGPVSIVDWHAKPDHDGDNKMFSGQVETQGWDGGAVEPLACVPPLNCNKILNFNNKILVLTFHWQAFTDAFHTCDGDFTANRSLQSLQCDTV